MKQLKAEIFYNGNLAGYLLKEGPEYFFQYDDNFLSDEKNPAISLTLPRRKEPFVSDYLFPFFFGLLSEGDNKELQCKTLTIDENDHFTRLIKTAGKDTIGGVTVKEVNETE